MRWLKSHSPWTLQVIDSGWMVLVLFMMLLNSPWTTIDTQRPTMVVRASAICKGYLNEVCDELGQEWELISSFIQPLQCFGSRD
jgi:hypothetical protein